MRRRGREFEIRTPPAIVGLPLPSDRRGRTFDRTRHRGRAGRPCRTQGPTPDHFPPRLFGLGMSAQEPQSDARDSRLEITDALIALRSGAPDAVDRLLSRVYDALHAVAHRQLATERPGHTLTTTDLVHEAYLKLVDQSRAQWTDRAQFFAVAARVMRRILVDYARRHRALRRGGVRQRVSLENIEHGPLSTTQRADELLELNEALERLESINERLSRVVECRFFAGLTEAETAEVLGVTPRTVTRDWARAKGWLYQELSAHEG